MPRKPPPPALVGGPYKSPRVRVGAEYPGDVHDHHRGELVPGPHPVRGFLSGPIPWPYTIASGSRHQPIVGGDLEAAIRLESVQAVSHFFGVSIWWVNRARGMLGVPRFNPGTQALWRSLTAVRLGDPRKHRGGSGPTKLTEASAAKLRAKAAKGERPVDLAREFGISRQYAGAIISGKKRVPAQSRST